MIIDNPKENDRVSQEEQPERPPKWQPLDPYRRALVATLFARATAYAKGFARRLAGTADQEDLLGVATEALVIAASGFQAVSADADERVLLALAVERMRGAMLDAFDRTVQNRWFANNARSVLANASRRLVWLCEQEGEPDARREVRARSTHYAVAYARSWSGHTAARTPEETLRDARLRHVFSIAEECLDPGEAFAIRGRFDDELTISEIAKHAGHSERTTNRQLRSALDKLRVHFEDAGITANDLLEWAA